MSRTKPVCETSLQRSIVKLLLRMMLIKSAAVLRNYIKLRIKVCSVLMRIKMQSWFH